MNILTEGKKFLKGVQKCVPKKVSPMVEFGFFSLSLSRAKSLNNSARSTISNFNTAKSKMWRLLKNKKLAMNMPSLLTSFVNIRDGDTIAIDFSDFKGFMVLMLAKQTKKGRAIPLFFWNHHLSYRKWLSNFFYNRNY